MKTLDFSIYSHDAHRQQVTLLSEDMHYTLIAQEGGIAWSSATDPVSGHRLILATAASEANVEQITPLLRHEYALRDSISGRWALLPLAYTFYHGQFALLYPWFHYQTLQAYIGIPARTAHEFIDLALRLCLPLQQLHRHGMIHGDIKPGNFFHQEEGGWRLAGFGLASETSQLVPQMRWPGAGGTLAYMSPEHTGRTRRVLSYASDLYSFGIVLYELLTGSLPFAPSEGSAAEWMHCHIASEPRPPHELLPDIPVMLSAVVLRLLTKLPEHRYQSVEGLMADLERCQNMLQLQGEIAPFIPAQQDYRTDDLAMPLPGGADTDLHTITGRWQQVKTSGSPALVLIEGAEGVGKSALISRAIKSLQQQNALLAVAKGDRLSPMRPYAVVTMAFRSLILHLLGQPEAEVKRWKLRITRSLGSDIDLALALLPELGALLESAPAATEHGFTEDQTRFSRMVLCLIKALTRQDQPLAIIVDDFHHADAASRQLLMLLLSHSKVVPLLLLVAVRDGMEETRRQLVQSGSGPCVITPDLLSVSAIAHWLAQRGILARDEQRQLAQLIHTRTGGNPRLVSELFRSALEEGTIQRDKIAGGWLIDFTALHQRSVSEHIASMALAQRDRLSAPAGQLLATLAVIGRKASVAFTARLSARPVEQVQAQLEEMAGLHLLTVTPEQWFFSHERIFDMALALTNLAQRQPIQLRAAVLLLEDYGRQPQSETLDQLLYALAVAANLARESAQQSQFIQAGITAVQQAKARGDYLTALRYLHTVRQLCLPDETTVQLQLDLLQAECEFLLGNLGQAWELCQQTLLAPGSLRDKAVAACLLAEIQMRQSDLWLALDTIMGWLKVFGEPLHRHPTSEECDAAWQTLQLLTGDDAETAFSRLPAIENADVEALIALLNSAAVFATFACPRLHFLLLCRILTLTLQHGLCAASCPAMAWFGVLLGHRYEAYSTGYQYALLARKLVNTHAYNRVKAQTLLALDLIAVWTQPIASVVASAKAAFTTAVALGDPTSACFAIRHQIINFITRGDHLDGLLTSIERGLAFVRKAGFHDVENVLLIQRAWVMFLRQTPQDELSAEQAIPSSLLPAPVSKSSPGQAPLMQFWFWLYRAMAFCLTGQFNRGLDCLERAAPFSTTVPAHIHLFDYHFYRALCLIRVAARGPIMTAAQRAVVDDHYLKIARWAQENPGLFRDKLALIAAEIARLDGNAGAALAHYEQAIKRAREAQFSHIYALSCELAAGFARENHWQVAADAYSRSALSGWREWGAQAKVTQMESHSPHLSGSAAATHSDTVPLMASEAARDLDSVVKAVRALTEEIDPDRLLHVLMTMLLERAGAQRGLLLRVDEGNAPWLEASAMMTADGVAVEITSRPLTSGDLPLSVVAAVIRTGLEIRTASPEVFSPFSHDPYLVSSEAAILCVPMFRQRQMVGILYLENRLLPDVFTAEHSRIIRTLAAQAAVSIEHARLYSQLTAENQQRRRVEKALRASQTSLMLGEQISHTGSWRWELQQDLMAVSAEYARILGLEEGQQALSMADFLLRVHSEDHARISTLVYDSVRLGVTMRAEFRILRPDGECRYLLGIGDPLRVDDQVIEYYGIISDITQQRMAENATRTAQIELARVSRATTVGQLTASIAHEINQPLMSIVTNAAASLRWLNRGEGYSDNVRIGLKDIADEGQRAGNIIRGLQALTRNQASVFAVADIHDIAQHILLLSRSELERKGIIVDNRLQAQASHIWCDNIQIQQVLLNLVVNAIDALNSNEDRPRILSLITTNPDAQTLCFTVADNGVGIEAEVMKRLFDSFYTTKPQGMGMGLTICNGIIERHNGKLQVGQQAPHGSQFWFTLPLRQDEAD
ncbi:trifunctional serine/threonine-protein kinase/ATP-binding protein/sensor histidine kinase [Pantoea sp. A4]|uniref:trifunctional serine/threonine-protein kinase/ATP-binding protein/sensor histidine kinase n=1 Tax=Pantoea sp. A4 TaxID=1225184 RepID=UPI0003784A13|nr:ATP-binding protein [Pantoea sp. A4]